MSALRPVPPLSAPPPVPRRPGLAGSFGHAWDGVLTACAQRNMKIHVVAATLVGLVGSGIPLHLAEKVSLIFCVLLVFFAEILNTALEALVDLHTEDFRDLARTTKDAAAAAVLVLAIGTVVIFAAIVVTEWPDIARHGPAILRQAEVGLPYAACVAALLADWKRSRWADLLLFAVGNALWVSLWVWTESYVFTALTGSLLWVAWSARLRHRPAT